MRFLLPCLIVVGSSLSVAADDKPKVEVVEVRKIWDQGVHNAFTDLVRFQDRWYCAFREGQGHVSPDGALRVLTSSDGAKWESAALIRSETADLRDPHLCVTPDGQLMINTVAALHDKSKYTHQSLVYLSKDGRDWGQALQVADPNHWLWRATWHKGTAYGIGYGVGKLRHIRLYRSADGRKFDTWVEKLFDKDYPNETSLVFLPDETCLCLLRRDGAKPTAQLGQSRPPYKEWSWKDLGVRIGGPHLIRLPDGRLVAVVRLYDGKVRTSICALDPEAGKIDELTALPSRSDTSYAGLVWHEGLLWISYYSSHEGKTSIYLAKARFPR